MLKHPKPNFNRVQTWTLCRIYIMNGIFQNGGGAGHGLFDLW
jgi:hypothetical protein